MLMRLGAPLGLAFYDNELYIAEAFKGRIIKTNCNTKKTITTKLVAKLCDPFALIFNKDNMFVSDPIKGKIFKIEHKAKSPKIIDLRLDVEAYGLAIKGDYLYAALRDENKVIKINTTIPNAQPIDVITGLKSPFKLAFFKDDLYVANACKISKINCKNKTSRVLDVIKTSSRILGMAFKGTELYFTSFESTKIVKIDVSRPKVKVLDVVTNLSSPHSLVFNNDDLYFSDISNSGRILKLNTKPLMYFNNVAVNTSSSLKRA